MYVRVNIIMYMHVHVIFCLPDIVKFFPYEVLALMMTRVTLICTRVICV